MVKTIVITGASSGFGKGVARKLAAQGHNLVLAARRDYLLQELVRELMTAIAVPTDVANTADVEHLASRAITAYGGFDVWINDAGVGAIGSFTDIPLEDQLAVVQTNLIGEMNGSYAAIRHFLERGSGTLINVASVAGKISLPYYAVYGATKAGVVSMSAAIRQELQLAGQADIHVCVVNPWATASPFWKNARNYSGHEVEMPALDDPGVVVDAIVDLIERPQDEVNVSVRTTGATPGLSEMTAAKLAQMALMDSASPRRMNDRDDRDGW